MEKEPKKEKKEVLDFKWEIPVCCREGWASCKHVPKKQKKVKNNIGM